MKELASEATALVDVEKLPDYDGRASIALNGDEPYFDADEALAFGNDYYSRLDVRGRCGAACAVLGAECMPVTQRGSIGDVKPSGWRIAKYDWIDGKYLYNRCHLIGYQLTGQNANERNLITGTRYLNVEGMQPFENGLANYLRTSGNHVLYRVTPVFVGKEPIARGVLMEARSLEDGGTGVCFCRWCPNVQPGVVIDYGTGKNWLDEDNPVQGGLAGEGAEESSHSAQPDDSGLSVEPSMPAEGAEQATEDYDPSASYDYILNKNSHLIHRPDCPKVGDMSIRNKLGFHGAREEVLALEDYRPCSVCNP